MSAGDTESPLPRKWLVVSAFIAVYVIWGSTYLAIRYVVETMPPFLSAAARFLVAGGIMYAIARARGTPAPTGIQWRAAAIVGGLLLLGGNGLVSWAEQWVPSGVAALLVATVPLWMVILEAARRGGTRPYPLAIGGVLLGIVGVGVLMNPASILSGDALGLGSLAILVATLSWATGSVYSRRAPLAKDPFMMTASEMVAGGAVLLVASGLMGEFANVDPASYSLESWLAFAYLVVFGSLVAFTAYVWLLQVSTPAKVGTYAFVNPVVAVALGSIVANEVITGRVIGAGALIVAAVVMILLAKARRAPTESARTADPRLVPDKPEG